MEEEDHWPLEDTRLVRGKKTSTCCVIAVVLGVVLGASIVVIFGLSVAFALKTNVTSTAPTSAPTPSSTAPTSAPTPSPASTPTAAPHGLSTCLTPECVELGSRVLSSLDDSIDPCDDFYKFACNKFLAQAILPYGETSTSPLASLMGNNQERFRALMESGNNRSVGALQKAINYYQSCMDGGRVEADSLPALTNLLTELGGWPLVGIDVGSSDPWDINDPQFLKEVLYGSDAFFGLAVNPDPYNSSRNILTVSQGGFTLAALEVYTNPDIKYLIKTSMVSVLKAINPSIDESVYKSAADDILDFEATMANFTDFFHLSQEMYVNKINVTTLSALQGYIPSFNWTQGLLYYADLGNFSVNTSAPVNVPAPFKFLVELDALIKRTNSTTLQNYAKWHLVYKLLPALSRPFSDVHYFINKLITGQEEPARYRTCVDNIQSQLPLALARAFTELYFPPEAQSTMETVLKELKSALKEIIKGKDWLDDATKQSALKKADMINEFLAYPNEIKNTAFLDEFYSKLNISLSESYFTNYLRTKKFGTLAMIAGLGRVNNRSTWELGLPFPPTLVNAAYWPMGNQIYILEGILNFPFFQASWPEYFKFGAIGFVVGHELVHGFDNSGRRFDEVGNFRNWWSSSSETEFNNGTKCFINQYNRYSLPAGHVNGTLTLGENIADNGGIATAYKAYKNRVNKTGEVEMLLPALNYTTDQLFFIASAQPWCERATPLNQKLALQDVHTPSSLRPLGFLSNSREFAAAFKCPKDSRMNPSHKCTIW